MQIPLQITLCDLDHAEALEAQIRARAEDLDDLFDHTLSCSVAVAAPPGQHHQGRCFNVRIQVGVGDAKIVVDHEHGDDIHTALCDAFDAAIRQIEEYARKLRGEIRRHQPRLTNEHLGLG